MSLIEIPEILKKYGGVFGKGLLIQVAPEIAKGAFVELLRMKRVDVKKATEWVLNNTSLWDNLEPQYQERFKQLAHKVDDVSWMDIDWAINAMKGEFPSLASLFLGWRKGSNWLGRQIEQIKEEVLK